VEKWKKGWNFNNHTKKSVSNNFNIGNAFGMSKENARCPVPTVSDAHRLGCAPSKTAHKCERRR
jgi:hypothetical protein